MQQTEINACRSFFSTLVIISKLFEYRSNLNTLVVRNKRKIFKSLKPRLITPKDGNIESKSTNAKKEKGYRRADFHLLQDGCKKLQVLHRIT